MSFTTYYKTVKDHHRNWPIDLLRGVLVLVGASGHFAYIMSYSGMETLQWSRFSALLAYNIPYGIAVFSPISGFLITTILLKYTDGNLHNINVPNFYLQRATRIIPGLLILCMLNLLFFSINYPGFELNGFSLKTILTSIFTFKVNVLFPDKAHNLWAWSILWSLSIEEVFYLFFPIICILLRTQKKVIIFLVIMIFYGPYCRLHAASAFSSIRLYFGSFDLIALGCLAALFTHNNLLLKDTHKPFRPKIWISVGLFLMIGMYFLGPWTLNNVCGPTLIALGVFMYLIGVTYNQKFTENQPDSFLKLLFKKLMLPLCVLGLLSYELYLYHVFFFLLFKPLIIWSSHKVGWSWFFSNTWMLGLEGLTGIFGWLLFFYCINPLRKKILARFGHKLDFITFIQVPQFFHKFSQQCNFIYHRIGEKAQ